MILDSQPRHNRPAAATSSPIMAGGESAVEPSSLVSVVIPVHNGAGTVARALESALAQRHPAVEVVVADDGSTDDTRVVAGRYGDRVRVVTQPNRGAAAARNLGICEARGEFLAFLDADDLWEPGALELQAAAMSASPTPDVVLGHVRLAVRPEAAGGFVPAGPPYVSYSIDGALFRRSVFDRVGTFDPALRFGEDVDWFLRAREAGIPMSVLPETTLVYRRHGGNMTAGKDPSQVDFIKAVKRSLDRRRAECAEAEMPPLARIARRPPTAAAPGKASP
jgi:glycosyltransferase involved in cell wall biosynthesis